MIGNVITVYINGTQVAQVTDSTFGSGNPGFGFFLSGGSGVNADYGFTDFTAADQLTADTTPPSTPTNLSANAVSSSQINLSWSASTDNVGVAGYQVFRNGTQIATTTSTSVSDGTVIAGVTYAYTVAAFDAAGNTSPQSIAVQTTPPLPPDTTPPTVPTGLTVIGTTTSSVPPAWSASSDNVGVAGYKIYRGGSSRNLGCSSIYGRQPDGINHLLPHAVPPSTRRETTQPHPSRFRRRRKRPRTPRLRPDRSSHHRHHHIFGLPSLDRQYRQRRRHGI